MSILSYPNSIGHDSEINPGWIEFSIFERRSAKSSTPYKTINLYLPEQMRNPNTISWGNNELGYAGNMLQGGGDFGEAAKRFIGTFASGVGNMVMRASGAGITADDIRAVKYGEIKNPYLTAMFKGVDFRTFDMTFKFHPRSEKDCDVIDQIVREFRGSSLPPGRAASRSSYLGYPREFEIKYIWQGKENPYLHKFKRCVLTTIDVDYTGMGQWAVMRNGFPAEIFMTLRFSEIELVLRDDVMQENY